LPKPLTQLGQCRIGLLLEYLTYHRERRVIAAGLAASGMWPSGDRARGSAPLYALLDKRAADAKQCR
jgi:hypothetical protein